MTQGEGGWGKGGGEVYQTVVGMLYLVCERELSVLMSIYIYIYMIWGIYAMLWVYLGDAGGVGGNVFGVVRDGVGKDASEVGEQLAEGAVAVKPCRVAM